MTTHIIGTIASSALVVFFAIILARGGEKWWKALIPVVSGLAVGTIANRNTALTRTLVASEAGSIITAAIMGIAMAAGASGGLIALFAALTLIVSIIGVVAVAITYVNLARAFGKGTGFGIGLLLVPVVFFGILAIGENEYRGPQGGTPEVAAEAA